MSAYYAAVVNTWGVSHVVLGLIAQGANLEIGQEQVDLDEFEFKIVAMIVGYGEGNGRLGSPHQVFDIGLIEVKHGGIFHRRRRSRPVLILTK